MRGAGNGCRRKSSSMAVEVTHLGRKRFENVRAINGAEVEDSVDLRSLILGMQSIDRRSSDDRACEQCQSQCDRSIHGVCLLAFFL
jgi:hypothetical protein